MELAELVNRLEECKNELEKIGAYSCYFFDGTSAHNGAEITIQMSNKDLPDGNVFYKTEVYSDYVVKNVAVGNVVFFALLTNNEAYDEGVNGCWGILN